MKQPQIHFYYFTDLAPCANPMPFASHIFHHITTRYFAKFTSIVTSFLRYLTRIESLDTSKLTKCSLRVVFREISLSATNNRLQYVRDQPDTVKMAESGHVIKSTPTSQREYSSVCSQSLRSVKFVLRMFIFFGNLPKYSMLVFWKLLKMLF